VFYALLIFIAEAYAFKIAQIIADIFEQDSLKKVRIIIEEMQELG
jgi:hypothetical protein